MADGMRPAPEHRAIEAPRENPRVADSPSGSLWNWAGHRSAAAQNRDRLLEEVLAGRFAGPTQRTVSPSPIRREPEPVAYRDLLDDLLGQRPNDRSEKNILLPMGADS
ncbi:MAG: hypothetical protein HQ581_14190 [Planctomycetes bacterium]|nr:hypothetical protein [Planctomycetota bacterium]